MYVKGVTSNLWGKKWMILKIKLRLFTNEETEMAS